MGSTPVSYIFAKTFLFLPKQSSLAETMYFCYNQWCKCSDCKG